MRNYRRLDVWQDSHSLTLDMYRLSARFPVGERYGLTSQLRRAAASIPTNIAEGAGRRTPADYARFLDIALGSTNEVEYQILLARDLGLTDSIEADRLIDRVDHIRRRLVNLRKRVTSSDA
ncbi:MAG TPA: four helix bundle protein [Acidimicrobiia bacterium]